MFWTVCVKLKLPLCEWRAAGLHAALQPAWHLAENQWVAAVWEGCQRGSFDSAQTPFGINWQSSAEGSPAFEEYVWLNCTCMWPSARPGKGFIVNMPGLSTGCRIKSVCTTGLGDGAHPPLNHLLSHSRSVIRCIYQSQKAHIQAHGTYCLKKQIGMELVDEHKRDIFAF